MYRVIYISHSKSSMSDDELDTILSEARRRNQAVNITGMLLYCGRTFFQVLEGPQHQVQATLDRVYRDPRHYRMKVLSFGPAKKRRFKDWSMGFRRLHKGMDADNSFFELSRNALNYRIPKNAAGDLLTLMTSYASTKLS
ncbi:Blue light- and temperature-regulated antirepressor YcgF [Pelagimonas phthalicica]|uniref:Blue light- and temperature-regulated antirepressor YcgF n=1 Tax=Pelagimonas phthalicica TaxID=1037362 RepID=A0A238JDI5_9RHOB|nr:BLUF domain-containing protein [Pelagimonas phthalicica]TDS90985.1 FAD-dependent sensor of blue light [Pelagimonas phthalicica]SMX28032.1 Blue light- and temperature-regulated antirepressor YcgF [Pelagimonas phthalicica]